MPNLIEVQKDSYQWFLKEGLKEVFDDISPIADFAGHLSLEFVDFTLCKDDIKYTIEECKERDATYAAPLKVKVRLHNNETEEISEHDIFMGDLPLMTATGTFVINGAERVIVSQLVRSPGIYYGIAHDKIGKELYSATVIPNRGAWLEYETDSNDIFYVRVDRNRKVPITVLIRALGVGTNQEILDMFGEEPKILASFAKDPSDNYQDGLLELYKKLRPGEPLAVDSAENLINSMFFDVRRYDLAKVGRYKFNKKLAFRNRIAGFSLAEDVISPETGEVLPEGTQGELVFTSITKEAFPLLRYRTRDICTLTREPCSCGRTHVKMIKPQGRTDDMLIIRGVNVFPSQIETVLLNHGYAANYQIIVDRVKNTDTLDVQVEMTPEMFIDNMGEISRRQKELVDGLRSMLGLAAKVTLVAPKSIVRSEGKAVRVIDKRKI